MLDIISQSIMKEIVQYTTLPKVEKEKVKYMIDLLLGEISKLLIMLLLFSVAGYGKPFIQLFLCLSITRIFIGGLHFKTYKGCLFFSIFYCTSAILLSEVCTITTWNFLILILFNALTILTFAPMQSATRPSASKRKIAKCRRNGCFFLLFIVIIFLANKNNPLTNIAIWVVTLQSIQLIIARSVHTYAKRNENQIFTLH